MNEFEVFKDINLFLRKVIFRYWHSERKEINTTDEQTKEEQEALEVLVSLLEENQDPDPDGETNSSPSESLRPSNLTIRSLKMPPLSKHKQIH